jgi:hypothetical protein
MALRHDHVKVQLKLDGMKLNSACFYSAQRREPQLKSDSVWHFAVKGAGNALYSL